MLMDVEMPMVVGSLTVVMGGTLGTGTFKSEKNLVFFQDKKSRSP